MRRLSPILALLFLGLLSGCGYTFSGMAPAGSAAIASRLPPDMRKMALVRIEDPTTEAWLEPRLRSLLRDEFTRRRLVVWTDKAHAESYLTIIIKDYTRSTSVTGAQEQSLKFSAGMTYVVKVTRASDGSTLWNSGELNQSESYYAGNSNDADQNITELAVRRIADLLSENY